MMKLEEINDPQALQQAAILLEKSVLRLQKENAQLRSEIARLKGLDVDPQMELALLKEQLAAMQQAIFGRSSERRPSGSEAKDTKPKEPRKGHGPRPQPRLPIEVVTHTLPEEERVCPFCGGQLKEWAGQFEESEEITVVGVEYKIVKHRRQKLVCDCDTQVVTAPGPVKLIRGGRYSIDFAVHVAESKYLDHLPLERQVRAMGRAGLEIDSQTLWDQIEILARHLEPTYRALCRKVMESEVVYADESRWQVMSRQGSTRWWTWCVASDEVATYRIARSRGAKVAREIFEGFGGVAMVDGYGAYQSLEKATRAGPGPRITWAHCWAHVRRKFLEAEDSNSELSTIAVDLIGELYAIEREVPAIGPGMPEDERERRLNLRRKLRDEKSRPKVRELRDWALEVRGSVLPQSKLGKAIGYMLNLWGGLTVFLDDPRVPLDNNAAERALRGVVVGRKNHYGSRSKRGTEVAALFYTLLETAKLSDVDPRTYLKQAAVRAIKDPGAVTLPQDLA